MPAPGESSSAFDAAPVLAVQGLSLSRDTRPVLSRIDLSLSGARTVAIVGPNGGGKTSLLRAILGLLPARGDIAIAGLSPREATRRGDLVGYVPQRPQGPAVIPITGRQAVRLAVSGRSGLLRRPDPAAIAWADGILDRVAGAEARALADMPITAMSGGQMQKIFLARALANRPRLLVLDEPTVGLDRPSVARLVELLKSLKQEIGLATLLATHDHLTAMATADEMIYLDGTIRYRGPADTLPPDLDARLCHHDHTAGVHHGGTENTEPEMVKAER